MIVAPIETTRLKLVPRTLEEVRVQVSEMNADERAQLSADWLARLESPTVDHWTLGFSIVQKELDEVVGVCGYKGPPGADGTVEIAYGLFKDFREQGYATEAAAALVASAFSDDRVRAVRAHTFSQANASARVLTKCGFQAVGEVYDPADGWVWRWEKVDTLSRRGTER